MPAQHLIKKYCFPQNTMQFFKVIFFRWSFVVTILFYICFCGLIWTITVPLKSEIQYKPLETQFKEEFDKSLRELPNVYNGVNSLNQIDNSKLMKKNEYLINVNDNEYDHKDSTEILTDIFHK